VIAEQRTTDTIASVITTETQSKSDPSQRRSAGGAPR
jgi:hypothetical protein